MQAEIVNISENDYHSQTGIGQGLFITRSMICLYNDDPASFKLRYIDRHPLMQFKENDGTRFGKYIESHLLDRDVSMYVKKPKVCLSAKGKRVPWNLHKSQYLIAGHGGPLSMTTVEWEAAHDNVISEGDEELAKLLELRFADTALGQYWLNHIPDSKKQVVIRWCDEETELPIQIRIDNWLPGVFICDLKSSGKPIEKFSTAADNFGYGFQHALYQDGVELATGEFTKFIFAIGETSGLKRAVIRELNPLQVEYSRAQYHKALRGIKDNNFMTAGFARETAEECTLPVWLEMKYDC